MSGQSYLEWTEERVRALTATDLSIILATTNPSGRYAQQVEWAQSELLRSGASDLLAAVINADGCFEAALAEGWIEALAAGDIDRIRDLWDRRLSFARDLFPAAIAKATGAA